MRLMVMQAMCDIQEKLDEPELAGYSGLFGASRAFG
jgi:hypothetical protein